MGNSKNTLFAKRSFLITVCTVLFLLFASLLAFDHFSDPVKKAESQQETMKTEMKSESEVEAKDSNSNKKKDSDSKEATEKKSIEGISFWGDELFPGEDEIHNSYRVKLQQLLEKNGYQLTIVDKTLPGDSTLSMLKMAGVSDDVINGYIKVHRENTDFPITDAEVVVRNFSNDELVRNDLYCLPILQMGYYGGWNHNPTELVEQQQKVLNTFKDNGERFIIIGIPPQDSQINMDTYEKTMKDAWGEHYVSATEVCPGIETTGEGQSKIAEAVYAKLKELGYISNKAVG